MAKKDVESAKKAEQEALASLKKAEAKFSEAQGNSQAVEAENAPQPSTGRMYRGEFVKDEKAFREARKNG